MHSILPAPDFVSNDNNYDNLLDGNMTTCVQLPHVSCGFGFKVCYRLPTKLWQGIVFSSVCLSVHRLDPQMTAADPSELIHLETLPVLAPVLPTNKLYMGSTSGPVLPRICSNLFTYSPCTYWQAGVWPSTERPSCLIFFESLHVFVFITYSSMKCSFKVKI